MTRIILLLTLCVSVIFAQGIIEPRQIKQGGADVGDTLKWDGAKWAPAPDVSAGLLDVGCDSDEILQGFNASGESICAKLIPTMIESVDASGGGMFMRVNVADATKFEWVTPGEVLTAIGAAAAAHASQHQSAGDDPVGNPTPGANRIVQAGSDGKIAVGWGSEVWAITDLTSYASTSGSGSTALLTTITDPQDGDCIVRSSGDWINTACATANAVGGASALTTAGLIPIVASSGIVTQDSDLSWNSSTNQMSLGSISFGASNSEKLLLYDGTTTNDFGIGIDTNLLKLYAGTSSSSSIQLGRLNSGSGAFEGLVAILNTGVVGIGDLTPSTSGTGKLHVSGNTARTLDTLRTVSGASDTGFTGETTHDADYAYFAVDTDSWKRTPLYGFTGSQPIASEQSPTDNYILMGTGSAWDGVEIVSCGDGYTQKFDVSANTTSCVATASSYATSISANVAISFLNDDTFDIDPSTYDITNPAFGVYIEDSDGYPITCCWHKDQTAPYTVHVALTSPRSGKVHLLAGGSDDFIQTGTGAVVRTVQAKLLERIPSVHDFNPDPTVDIGDGSQHPLSESFASYAAALAACPYLGYEPTSLVTDMATTGWQTEELFTCAFNKAIKAQEATGGGIYFPRGHYYTSSQAIVKASARGHGWKFYGDGYETVIQVRPGGWYTSDRSNRRGVFTFDHNYTDGRYADDISIEGLRFIGVQDEVDAFHRPHAIYSSDASSTDGTPGDQPQYNVHISHCWFELFDREVIWQSAWEGSWRWTIDSNIFRSVTTPAQLNLDGATFTNNYIYWDDDYSGGTDIYGGSVGVAATGRNMTITGNTVMYPTVAGVYAGDGHDISGTIAHNHIFIAGSTSGARAGILSSISRNLDVSNNFVRIEGTTDTVNTYGIHARYNGNIHISDNEIEVHVSGFGIDVSSGWIDGGYGDQEGTLTAVVSDNRVRFIDQDVASHDRGISANGFATGPLGELPTTIIYSSGNIIAGMDENDVALDYGDDEVTATVTGDIVTDAGQIKVRPRLWYAKTGIPIYDQTGATNTALYARAAEIGMLNFGAPKTLTIASGVIDLDGLVTGNGARRQTRITLDTESSAATDDLDTISNGQDGDLVILGTANAARDVRITAAGNILVGTPISLTDTGHRGSFVYSATLSKWVPQAWNFYSPVSDVGFDFPAKTQIFDRTPTTGVSQLSVIAGAGQSTTWLFEARDGTTAWSKRICGITADYALVCDALTDAVTTARTTFNTIQSSAAFLGSNGQIVQQFRNRDTTTNNWAIQAFQDGAGIVAAAFGVQYTDQTNHYGKFDFRTRAADGILSRLVINENGVNASRMVFLSGTEPTCDSSARGVLVLVQGGAGVADTLRICTKDAADAYAYRALF